ncbi:hypothetical protein LEP1GSC062_1134 [Leptospira alexanderi serovar Manhao 3 str. L 60]|uniref:Uncharacterized protein n=1 Tax=Leptospira alexanderi serovar Manhao 3 str. L 60 TaxID=1049759 RepID=V6I7U8_9LEPT|nr:hypothetical protein LEP1GSC062_1134 [Leptospira alexanderi serovar Manhao 3 str. L 60]
METTSLTACKDSDLRRIVSGCEQILSGTTRDNASVRRN